MNEAEFLLSLVSLSSPMGMLGLGVFLYKIWDKLNQQQKNIEMLNHNSSTITKALLSSGVLKPEDIKDVEL